MSKESKKKQKVAKAEAAEPPELHAEVRAFASQLGLGGAGGLEHAFDDFAPKQAKQKLGKASKRKADALDEADEEAGGGGAGDGSGDPAAAAKAAKAAARKQRTADKAAAKGRGKQPVEQPASVIPPVSDAMAAAIKERQWNVGAGPRPGKHTRSGLRRHKKTRMQVFLLLLQRNCRAVVTHVAWLCSAILSVSTVSQLAGDGKRSLLDRDAPALWYEALAALPLLPSASAPPDEGQVQRLPVDLCTWHPNMPAASGSRSSMRQAKHAIVTPAGHVDAGLGSQHVCTLGDPPRG